VFDTTVTSQVNRSAVQCSLWKVVTLLGCVCFSNAANAQPNPRGRETRRPVLAVPTTQERNRARRLGIGTREAADTMLHEHPRVPWVTAANRRGRATRKYLWPVRDGVATQGFNGQEGRHRALDIGAPCGTPIRAGHAGVVGFSAVHGNSGNLVVILHPGGWVTAYGHTRRTLVAAGAFVRRGQVIAEVGDTGDAHGCHVHFIVARNGTRLDPEQHVSGRPAVPR
jgi:murein DD-endopeptidase MepM/ murein hydrolase activator NlpD